MITVSFRDRFTHAVQDTRWFKGWPRNAVVSLVTAALTFLARTKDNQKEAVQGLRISVLVFAATFIVLPFLEFIWKFFRAPREILETRLDKEEKAHNITKQELAEAERQLKEKYAATELCAALGSYLHEGEKLIARDLTIPDLTMWGDETDFWFMSVRGTLNEYGYHAEKELFAHTAFASIGNADSNGVQIQRERIKAGINEIRKILDSHCHRSTRN